MLDNKNKYLKKNNNKSKSIKSSWFWPAFISSLLIFLLVIIIAAVLFSKILLKKTSNQESGLKNKTKLAVEILKPQDKAVFYLDSGDKDEINITIDLDVSTITKIESVKLYINSQMKKTFSGEPYKYDWSVNKPGNYTIQARITDSKGKKNSSNKVTITIKSSSAKSSTTLLPNNTSTSLPENSAILTIQGNISASSFLSDKDGISFKPVNAFDGKDNTCWSEGVDSYGLGEWIAVDFNRNRTVKRIGMIVGFNQDDLHFYGNNRVKRIIVEFSDGTTTILDFADKRKMQYLNIIPKKTSSLRFYIDSVYNGNRWNDTCISEISINGD